MKFTIIAIVTVLLAACQTHQPLDKASTNPYCQGYSDGYTERC